MIEPLLEAERAMDLGLLDRAEGLYRGVVERDPRSSIAVVGLARVALERGDEDGALVLSRQAVGIDPENPMAARMVARLEEVLATRARASEPAPTDASATTGSMPDAPVPTGGTDARESSGRRRLVDRLLRRP